MTTLSIQRTVAGALTSADAAHVVVTNSAGSIVVASTLVAPISEGVYTYETVYLTPGIFTATWTFTVSGQPDDVVSRIFEADSAISLVQGVTLAEIEQRVARCVGPYRRFKSGSTSTVEQLFIQRLKSRIDSGDYENMFILRRGVLWDGSLIANFNANDRYRAVETYTAATGIIEPDEGWAVAPATNEAIEFHSLDPEQELRPIVLDGLRRCFFWDQLSIAYTGALRETNLTTLFPYIDNPRLIGNVGFLVPGSGIPASDVPWYQPYYAGGSVLLNTGWLGAGTLRLDVLRRHSSYVNGEMSQAGPNSDSDVLAVEIEYAVLSAWVQAWVQLTDRLTATAAQGNRLTSDMVAAAFTQKSIAVANQIPERVKIRYENVEMLTQIGNAMEAEI